MRCSFPFVKAKPRLRGVLLSLRVPFSEKQQAGNAALLITHGGREDADEQRLHFTVGVSFFTASGLFHAFVPPFYTLILTKDRYDKTDRE